jgi:hypothetical protein
VYSELDTPTKDLLEMQRNAKRESEWWIERYDELALFKDI